MNRHNDPALSQQAYSPLRQLILARVREFYREPEAIFWVYGFPILIVVALGIAFRNKPVERSAVDVEDGPRARAIVKALETADKFTVMLGNGAACRLRLRTGKTDVVVLDSEGSPTSYQYLVDPARPESRLARNAVDDALQRAAGRQDPVPVLPDERMLEPGARYIDFLVPGLLGMSLMGGGLWGIGFVTVDMRIRKLLKRFLATPMRKSHFLAAIMMSRLLFMIPEMLITLVFAWLTFGVVIQGSLIAVVVLILLGAFTFSGLGLLVASRAKTIETVSGLMNLVMLPMWVLSGIFFSPDRFPDVAQPFIKALPLTPLIHALRAVMLESASLTDVWVETAILAAWGAVSFVLALRWFRWN
jgi:ABC-type multidrug transport system permease subunit